MDATDDMGGPSSDGSGQTGGYECSACFETDCAWESTECAADPECAEWLSCAKNAPAGASGGLDPDWLDQSCGGSMGPTASSLRNALASCLTGTPCCEGRTEDSGGDPALGGADAGAYGDTDAPGGGQGGTDGNGAGDANAPVPGGWACDGENCTCKTCLAGVATAGANEDDCAGAFEACMANQPCHDFAVGYSGCLQQTDSASDPASGSQRGLEACLFHKALEYPGGFEFFMTTVYPCALSKCGQYCVLNPALECAQCQQLRCADALEVFHATPDAMLLKWCHAYCQLHPNDGDCPGKCEPYVNNAALSRLQMLGECVQASCPDEC